MNFFLLDDPARPGDFARFSHVGTWTRGSICRGCGLSSSELVEPLKIEWDPGTERIGDFSWCGYHCVVVDNVRRFLANAEFECEFGLVEVVPPTEPTRMPRVPFPYRGPVLSWLIPTKRLPLNTELSGLVLASDCPECGQRRYRFKRDHLVVDARDWNGEKIFRLEQFGRSRATFITEFGLDAIKTCGFTNLCPRSAGTIEGR